jgi:hypothetical protein
MADASTNYTMMSKPRLTGILLFLSMGCSPPPAERTAAVVRDSAGVRIVENSQGAQDGPTWRLSSDPAVQIGSDEGPREEQFHRIMHALRVPDGRIAVADQGSGAIRIFDARGRFLSRIGGAGGGPGEFGFLTGMQWVAGDTLLAFDAGSFRVLSFDLSGRLLEETRLRRDANLSFPTILGRHSDGSFHVAAGCSFDRRMPPGEFRNHQQHMLYSRDGTLLDTLGARLCLTSWIEVAAGSTTMTRLPFGRSGIPAVSGDEFLYGDGDRYEIAVHSATGELRRLIRLDRPNRPVSSADIEWVKESRLAEVSDERYRSEAARSYDRIQYPETMPAFERIIPADDGSIWIQLPPTRGEDSTIWDVFDRDGAFLGQAAGPARFQMMHVGADLVTGVWRNDLGVEVVQVHRVVSGTN